MPDATEIPYAKVLPNCYYQMTIKANGNGRAEEIITGMGTECQYYLGFFRGINPATEVVFKEVDMRKAQL